MAEERSVNPAVVAVVLLDILLVGVAVVTLKDVLPISLGSSAADLKASGYDPVTQTVRVSNAAALTAMFVLIICAYALRDGRSTDDARGFFRNLLAILGGAAIGWVLSVLWVPFDEVEKALYSNIGVAVVGFLSGVFVTYVLPHFQAAIQAPSTAFKTQLSLATVALLVAGSAIVANRTEYMQQVRKNEACLDVLRAEERAQLDAIRSTFARKVLVLSQGGTVDGIACVAKFASTR